MNTVMRWCIAMIVVGTIVGCLFCGLSGGGHCDCHSTTQSEETNIRRLDVVWWGQTQNNVYLFEDTTGNQWEVTNIPAPIGNNLIIELDNMGTPNRYWDDEVVAIYQAITPEAEG